MQVSRRRAVSRTVAVVAVIVILVVAGGGYYYYTTSYVPATTTPIKIGVVIQESGFLALAGVPGLTAINIWANDTNAAGGISGHKVQIIAYDDASDTSKVPALIQKLISVDNVDYLVTLGTVDTAAAMPVASQSGKILLGLFGTNANAGINYNKFFQAAPIGPDPNYDQVRGYFELAASINPKPQTVAFVAVQNDFGQQCSIGGAKAAAVGGFRIVDNETYPPTQTDFTSLMQKVKSTNPDIAFICSYPSDSVGIVQASKGVNFTPKLMGGGMIGPQFTALEAALGKSLQGIVTFAYWVPEPTLNFPGVNSFILRYEAVANASGAAAFDPLGYLYPPYSYAAMQMLTQAIQGCNCFGNNDQLGTYIHGHTFTTIGGNMTFAASGEWSYSRVLWIQYQNIAGASVSAFSGPGHQVIVWPAAYKSGNLVYPFAGWSG
ncbi:MAG: amino acid ABC transporter substrate-binding protein [Thaumarchaeota archaeon]|nr:amino acid ABC transporter substrate-binding protein [Nitrososphaerota archaeon]